MKLPSCELFYHSFMESFLYCKLTDLKNPNFKEDIGRRDETQAVMLSNFVFIGAVEVYTREGETDCEEIPKSGKQRM